MKFVKTAQDPQSGARCGVITTDHGQIETPIFMPVGTVGSVKGVYHRDLKEDIEAQIILGNTYHLYLRPGLGTLKAAGGLHKFISWDRPILTDSGGFQVFSLTGIRKLTPDGCTFSSHIDGSRHTFTPENNVDTQRIIGADIMMAFDECCPGDADYNYAKKSLLMTQSWLERFLKRFDETEPLYGYSQTVFPIVQGCVYPELRKMAVEHAVAQDREGYAIGGLAVGEPTEKMYEMLELVCPMLPEDRPRYLMGVGTPVNILEAVARGIDFFHCVMPARNARHGKLFTWQGTMNIKNAKYKLDDSPIDPECDCPVCRNFSRSYIRHLFAAEEILAMRLTVMHNLYFYNKLTEKIRDALDAGRFEAFRAAYSEKLSQKI